MKSVEKRPSGEKTPAPKTKFCEVLATVIPICLTALCDKPVPVDLCRGRTLKLRIQDQLRPEQYPQTRSAKQIFSQSARFTRLAAKLRPRSAGLPGHVVEVDDRVFAVQPDDA